MIPNYIEAFRHHPRILSAFIWGSFKRVSVYWVLPCMDGMQWHVTGGKVGTKKLNESTGHSTHLHDTAKRGCECHHLHHRSGAWLWKVGVGIMKKTHTTPPFAVCLDWTPGLQWQWSTGIGISRTVWKYHQLQKDASFRQTNGIYLDFPSIKFLTFENSLQQRSMYKLRDLHHAPRNSGFTPLHRSKLEFFSRKAGRVKRVPWDWSLWPHFMALVTALRAMWGVHLVCRDTI